MIEMMASEDRESTMLKPIQHLLDNDEILSDSDQQKKRHWQLYYWRQQILWFALFWAAIEMNFIERFNPFRESGRRDLNTSDVFGIFGLLSSLLSWILSSVPIWIFIFFPLYLISIRIFNNFLCFQVIDYYFFYSLSFILIVSYVFVSNITFLIRPITEKMWSFGGCSLVNLVDMNCRLPFQNYNWMLFYFVGTIFFGFNATFAIYGKLESLWPGLSDLKRSTLFLLSIFSSILLILIYMHAMTLVSLLILEEMALAIDKVRNIWLFATCILSLGSFHLFYKYTQKNYHLIHSTRPFTLI